MTRRISPAAVLSLVAFAVLIVAVWHYVLTAAGLWFAYRILRWKHGPKRRPRPRSSWSSLGRTAALMFAAWQARWLKPTSPITASIPAQAGAEHRPEGWDR